MEHEKGFRYGHLTRELVGSILKGIEKNAIIDSWCVEEIKSSGGVITNIDCNNQNKAMLGIFKLKIDYHNEGCNDLLQAVIVLKSKPTGDKVVAGMAAMLTDTVGSDLADAMQKEYIKHGVLNMHQTEILFVNLCDPMVKCITPDYYWSMKDDDREIYVFAMEYFDPGKFTIIDSLNEGIAWKHPDILDVIEGLALIHSRYYRRTSEIPAGLKDQIYTYNQSKVMKFIDIFKYALLSGRNHPEGNIWEEEVDCDDIFPTLISACDHMVKIAEIIEKGPHTLIHGDPSIRNICIRSEPREDKSRVCFYDWEALAIGPPQVDLSILLAFSFNNTSSRENILSEHYELVKVYIDFLKRNLPDEFKEDEQLDFEAFVKVFDMCYLNVAIHQLGVMTSILKRKMDISFIKGALRNCHKYVSKMRSKYEFLS